MVLTPAVLESLTQHAREDALRECCGALFGQGEAVHATSRCENSAPAERRAFEYAISPRDYLAAERTAEARGWSLLGFYHSHPTGPASPSAHDHRAASPGLLYVIVGLEPLVMTAWRAVAGRLEPVSLEVASQVPLTSA